MRWSTFFLLIIFVASFLVGGDFFYYRLYRPCDAPLPYSIGFIDPRQNITREQLVSLLHDAEAVWETPIGRNLFQPETTNDFFGRLTGRSVTVNVRYDERQVKKDTLTEDQRILDTSAQDLAQEKTSLALLRDQFTTSQNLYESHVVAWNKSKRNDPGTYTQLQNEKTQLEQLEQTLTKRVAAYNANVNTYNKDVNEFNTQAHFEDEAGTTRGNQIIDLYILDKDEKDTLLIAHELGHAIGINEHSSDEGALMYYRLPENITGINDSDISLISKACKW